MNRRVLVPAVAGLLTGMAAAAIGFSWSRGPVPHGDPAVPVTVVTDPRVQALPSPPAGAPNVVLVIGCTVRRDQVTPYGGPASTTPFLATLAERGALLEDPITAAPWTRAASAAIVTGHHALELGMVDPGDTRNDRRLPGAIDTLAERFRSAGYTTIGATANPNLNAAFGFEQGFDRYLQPRELWRDNMVKISGTGLLPELIEQIDTRPDPERPVFLQVMLVDAHAPFDPTPEELEPFLEPGVPEEVLRYRTGLRGLDDAVHALYDALPAAGLAPEHTVFAFVSDHGEGLSMPEHHGKSHGRYLYSSAVHGVWLASGPGIPAGSRVPGVASQLDIGATLLGLAGLPSAVGGEARDLSGPVREASPTGRERAFTDTWFMTANRAASYGTDLACMMSFAMDDPDAPTGRFVPGCYDRTADPDQRQPLEPTDDARMVELIRWRADTTRRALEGEVVDVDADLDLQLRSLGYVQVEEEP
ncbi:MAG: sulfatase-like hydrolase/transferase [Myxococcota bacterium]